MPVRWIVSLGLGLAVMVYAGGYHALDPVLVDAMLQYGFAAVFVGLHVFIWTRPGRVFTVLRVIIWAIYLGLLAAFLLAYFPRGVIPVLSLLASNVTLPMALGFLAMAIPAMIRRRKRAAPVVSPSPSAL